MNLSQFLLIISARRKVILFTLAATVLTTLVVSLLLPKSYESTTSLVLNYKGIDPVSGTAIPAQLMPGYMATQVDIIQSKSVAIRVVESLRLAENPVVREEFQEETEGRGDIKDWLAGLLIKRLKVVPSRESSVLDISFNGSDPMFAAAIANAFASEYQKITVQLKVQPLQQASNYFNEQIKVLRDNLETAQGRLSKYQQDKGLVSVDNRLDVESARLNDLSTQLVVVQGLLMEALSRKRQAQGADGGDSPDVLSNPLVQNLKASLAQAEAKFSEVSERLGSNHPNYQSAKAEVDKLRTELSTHTRSASNSVSSNAVILQRREAELRTALDAQKTRVLELNRARDELAVLARDVESAQRAYDGTVQRFNQTNLEGQSNQAEVAVLNPAVPPIKHSSPRIALNVLLAIFVGTMLGLGFGMVAEMIDRRIRSTLDLTDMLQIPVLCVLERSQAKRAPRRMFGMLPRPAAS